MGSVFLAKMEGMKFLTDVASDQLIASPQITVEIDRQAASTLGVTPAAIDAALYAAFGQEEIANIYTTTQQPRLILEVQPKFQLGPTALSGIYVASSSGGQVPLAAFAHETHQVVPLTVNHQGVFPSVTLSFNLTPGGSLSQAVDAISSITSLSTLLEGNVGVTTSRFFSVFLGFLIRLPLAGRSGLPVARFPLEALRDTGDAS